MKIFPFLSALACLSILTAAPAVAAEKVDGWGKLKFGMALDEAVRASPEIGWPENVCVDGLPCTIKPDSDYVAIIGGIGFVPEMAFDRFGRLVQVALRHNTFLPPPEGETDCWGRFNRTVNGLEKRFGTFDAPMTEGLKLEKRRTPGGSHYSVERLNMDGIMFLMFKTASDTAAFDTHERNELAGTGLRAPRSFVSITGVIPEEGHSCAYSVYYIAADMEAPRGAKGGDNAGF